MEFNFINPGHVTTTFDTVAIYGRRTRNKYVWGGQSFIPRSITSPLPNQLPVSLSQKNSRDETTV